jgi:hypothetical protein
MPAKRPAKPTPPAERAELTTLARKLAALDRMTVAKLKAEYETLTGEPTRTNNRDWLVKKVGYLMQARAHGGLSERAQMRLSELGDTLPEAWRARVAGQPAAPAQVAPAVNRDPRLPPAGETIEREHGGKTHVVTVLDDSFIYDGKHYKTLSQIAREITGTNWNGFRFFNRNK